MTIGQWVRADIHDSSKKNTIAVLDGVRAFACISVVWYHLNLVPRDFHIWNMQQVVPSLIYALMYYGKYGVTLFFVLSGFLLFMPYAKALLFETTWPSAGRFYLRRVFRILPAYYLSLILIVVLFHRQYLQPQHWGELGLFFVMLMDSSKATFKQLNAPFWTLAIEWQYYMLLPLLVLGMGFVVRRVKQGHRLHATIACILALIVWGVFTRYVGNYFVYDHPTASVLVPRPVLNVYLFFTYGMGGKFLEDFGVGLLLSLCFIYAQQPSVSTTVHNALRRLSPYFWVAGLLSLFVMILWNYNQSNVNTWPVFNLPIFYASYYTIDELCFSLAFGLCIIALLFGYTWLKRPFEWSPLRWIGMISFSLYMWHFPLLVVFMTWGQPLMKGWPLALNYSMYWLWVLVVITPFCFLFYKWVEKPGMKFGERFTRQKPPTPTPPNPSADISDINPAAPTPSLAEQTASKTAP
jgi:peptidoglycan/LPS O-acetylase OafA/YrhL